MDRIVLERAATALTLTRLLGVHAGPASMQAQHAAVTDMVDRRYLKAADMHARAAALGVPTAGQGIVAVVADAGPDPAGTDPVSQERDLSELSGAIQTAGLRAMLAAIGPGRILVLLPVASAATAAQPLSRLAQAVHAARATAGHPALTLGVGSVVTALEDVARSAHEATQAAAAGRVAARRKPYYEVDDVQLRGVLRILGDEPLLQSFVERTLGDLLAYDARNGTDLLRSLQLFLRHGGNKTAAASAANFSRQAFYHRLATIERVLGVDLESAEVCTSLHAAVMLWEARPMRPFAASER